MALLVSSSLTLFVRRLTFRLAVRRWSIPLPAALAMTGTATLRAARAPSGSPASMASKTFLDSVFIRETTRRLRARLFKFCLARLMVDLCTTAPVDPPYEICSDTTSNIGLRWSQPNFISRGKEGRRS